MSYHVFFSFSTGLAKSIKVPYGTKVNIMNHIEHVERALGLKRTKYLDNPVHWDNFDSEYRNGFPSVGDADLCGTVQTHNEWVHRCYREIDHWSKHPFKKQKEIIKHEIEQCYERISFEIAENSTHGHIAAGLSSEGFAGGYRAALEDVLLLLGGNDPGNNRRYWEDWRRNRQKKTAASCNCNPLHHGINPNCPVHGWKAKP